MLNTCLQRVIIWCAFYLVACAQAPSNLPYVVKGTVRSSTGEALGGATVVLRGNMLSKPESTVTDDHGTFAFQVAGPGSFALEADLSGFLQSRSNESPGTSPKLILTGTARVVDITISMVASATITGHVYDAQFDPIPSVRVGVFSTDGAEPRHVSGALTDDRGIFRISGLYPGHYVLGAIENDRGQFRQSAPRVKSRGFLPTFYPNATSVSNATVITLVEAESTDLNVLLREGDLFTVRGIMQTPSYGVSYPSQRLTISEMGGVYFPSNPFTAFVVPGKDGSFEIRNLPPGRYVIEAGRIKNANANAGPLVVGSAIVSVIDRDIDNVVFTAAVPSLSIRGTVIFEGTSPPQLSFRLESPPTIPERYWSQAHFESPTLFRFDDLDSRPYRFVMGSSDGWYVKAVQYDGRDIGEDAFIPSTGALSIIVASK